MLKKAKAAADEGAGLKDLSQEILDSSHQIWLAGLGAFSRAQQEGRKLFEALVQQGENLQDRTKRAASETAAAARGAAAAKAKEMQQMAGGTWDKLEQVFEDRVARALSKLGVYTQNDVQRLATRVDELADAVNKLIATTPGATAPPRKGAARKGTAKKAAKKTAKKGTPRKPSAGAKTAKSEDKPTAA